MQTRLWCIAGAIVLLVGCDAPVDDSRGLQAAAPGDRAAPAADENGTKRPPTTERIDPRRGGFEIALGEWALAPEAPAIRPGRVTFVIHNRGTMAHGFEIALEGESSGHGSGDLFKAEGALMRPGTTTRVTLDLAPGLYEIECLVDGHDDMGMEGILEVRGDAPLALRKTPVGSAVGAVTIDDFAFSPAELVVDRGTEVSWRNDDVAPHTVTSTTGDFDSETLDPGDGYSFRFSRAGTYAYRCVIHPEMKGSVKVR